MEITLTSPLDMHLHVRDGEMMRLVAPLSAQYFAGAVIMPNLVPPVVDEQSLRAYAARVKNAADDASFLPLMTLFFRNYSESDLRVAKNIPGFFAVKLYNTRQI